MKAETQLRDYRVEIATDFGPRITGVRFGDGPQLFASLDPAVAIPHPSGDVFRFRGGHRLWVSPEMPEVTYAPDQHECRVTEGTGSITVSAPEDGAGVLKEISVTARDDRLVVEHRLSMTASGVAPWAITQFPLGGTAIIPFTGDDNAPLPNRHLVAWPYTSMADDRITLGEDQIEIAANEGPTLKLGTGLGTRRLAYYRGGYLFIKESGAGTNGAVPDMGASLQVYVGKGFCELETVDTLRDLHNGETAHYTEEWWVRECGSLEEGRSMVMEG